MGDDLASSPEVERAASIGSAYVGSNPRPPRGTTRFTRYLRPLLQHETFRVREMSHVPSDAESLIAYHRDDLDRDYLDGYATTSKVAGGLQPPPDPRPARSEVPRTSPTHARVGVDHDAGGVGWPTHYPDT
jgi:hypothetical protein